MYTVVITHVQSGETRRCVERSEWHQEPNLNENGSFFWWTEGNASCDCSLASYFADAGGEPRPHDVPCGDSRYRVERIELPDGQVIKVQEA